MVYYHMINLPWLCEGGVRVVLWPIYLIAIISTVGCIILWFRDVRRVMREQESTVESAHRELAVWRDKAQKAQGDPESVAICERCEDVYQQAVAIYNRTMQKPFHYLPARLMGFHRIFIVCEEETT